MIDLSQDQSDTTL